MLAIARALMLRPRLLLLDEPSLGLAPLITRELFKIAARRSSEDEGTTLLVVEQNANLALDFADHAYVLETGRIVLDGHGRARSAPTRASASAYLGTDLMERFIQLVIDGIAIGVDLRRAGAGARADLPHDRDRQLRPGRDGDVLDLHRLGPGRGRAAARARAAGARWPPRSSAGWLIERVLIRPGRGRRTR